MIRPYPKYKFIDFLRIPRPQGERRKSIYSPRGWGKKIDFRALLIEKLIAKFSLIHDYHGSKKDF
jgi:hypothetical protein